MKLKQDFKRYLTLLLFVAGMGSVAAQNIPLDPKEKPNILWVITEDMSAELGCYGYPLVQTPNLDAFAKKGVRYTQAYVTGPVCSASRSALITAMYQTTIGAHNHRSHRSDNYKLPHPVKPITDYFREAGYFTSNGNFDARGVSGAGKTDYNFNPTNKVFDGFDWRQRKNGQPFFAQLMIGVTHRGPVWQGAVQKHEPQIQPDKVSLPPFYPDVRVAREDWATYLESIQLMDFYFGKIMARLQEDGLEDNTLVIFMSDHGRCMVRDKQFLYDGGIHIPLLMRWPHHLAPGTVNNDMVSAIDISATVLKVAGVDPPAYMEGRPILGANVNKRDHIIAARDRMDETVDMMRCVRTRQFKYIKNYMPERPYMQSNRYKETEYPVWNLLKEMKAQGKLTPAQAKFCASTKPVEELYDVVADPYELTNLAASTKYKKTLLRMRGILEDWVKKTRDQGQLPERPESVFVEKQN
jgi:uncharacterized sulfatase